MHTPPIFLPNWHLMERHRQIRTNRQTDKHAYKGRSIKKVTKQRNSVSFANLKIQNICFVANFTLNMCRNFIDDDVIIVTSSVHRTQPAHVLFSPPVIYHNSQVRNSIGTKINKLKNLTPLL